MSDNFKNNHKNNEQSKFGLPDGYFQKSAATIFNKIEWQDEHKEFVNLLNYKNKSGFIVPANYFKVTAERTFTLSGVEVASTGSATENELLEFPTLSSLTKTNAFKVPDGYFELASTTLSLTTTQPTIKPSEVEMLTSTNELSEFPTLASLKKQNKFSVPANYFESVAKRVVTLNEVEVASRLVLSEVEVSSATSKVINLFSAKTWYSVAALLVIALGLWMYNSYYKLAPVNDCGTLACVDKIDLIKAKYLEIDNVESEELYKLVNTKKLEENLEKKSGSTNSTNSTKNKQNTDSSLNSVSTDELLDEL